MSTTTESHAGEYNSEKPSVLQKPSLLQNPSGHLLGLDIGGTKTAVLLVDRKFQVVGQLTRPTVTSSPEELVAAVLSAIDETLAQAGVLVTQIGATGIAVPGLVNSRQGIVELAINLNLAAYPLGPILAGHLQTPCNLENDVRSAALGAYRYVNQQETLQHLAYLSIGTGIAAGVVLNGRLYKGARGMAGEIGHVIVEPDGPICVCGQAGCLEAVASGSAIARMAGEQMTLPGQTLSVDGVPNGDPALTAKAVFEAARQGDPIAAGIIQQASRYLARAIQFLIMAYDVQMVVLGGGVTHAGPALLDPILVELAALRSQSALATAMLPDDKISLLPAGYNAGAWGAIMMSVEEENHETK
jgi:glucokinase